MASLAPLIAVARSRDLRRVEVGFLAFNLAEWGTWVSMLVYAYGHGGATASGIVATILLIPAGLVAPALAVLADRYRPALVLLAGYLSQALMMGAMALVIGLDAPPLAVYAVALAYSCTFVVTRPTQAVLLPQLTTTPDELTATYVVSGWMETVALIAGPAAAGLLLEARGPALVFAVFAALSFLSAGVVLPIARRAGTVGSAAAGEAEEEGEGAGGGLVGALASGLAVLRVEPGPALLVAVVWAGAVLLGALDVLYVQLAVHDLGMGNGGAGLLNAVFGVGAVVGGAATVLLIGRRYLAPPLYFGIAVAGGSLALLTIDISRTSAVVAIIAAGAGQTLLTVTGRTFLQRITPEAVVGRIFGLLEGAFYVGQGTGALIVPALVAIGGTGAATLGLGLLLPAAGALALARLVRLDRRSGVHPAEIALLRGHPLFRSLRAPALETLAGSLQRTLVTAGAEVVTEGAPGDAFYLIAEGRCRVTRRGVDLRMLGPGDGFGEIALLRDVPRTATVAACEDTVLYRLAKAPFLVAITGHAPAAKAADDLVGAMLATSGDDG